MTTMRWSDYYTRVERLKELLWSKQAKSIDEICIHVCNRPEWLRKDGTPFPNDKAVEREVRAILRNHPVDFVSVDDGALWRRRDEHACSFCLTEDVQVAKSRNHFICLECAQVAVTFLSEKKAMKDQAEANTAKYLRFEEILGA
jgi:hypothetical protein